MTVHFEREWGGTFDFEEVALAEALLDASLDYLACPYEVECDVLLTGDGEIRELNREFRQVDAATDVLSFPMVTFGNSGERDADKPYDPSERYEGLEEDASHFSPETGELLIGDVVVSGDKVVRQAQEYGHSEMREFAFLIVHGILHLMGLDHVREEEREQMEDVQREILERMGIGR